MKNRINQTYRKSLFLILGTVFVLTQFSCFNDLNTTPLDDELITSGIVYDDLESYKGVLAKLYAGLAVSGQQGPAGQGDISGLDEGFGQYLRGYYYHQEFTTDEAIVGWNDQTITDFHDQDWTASDGFQYGHYSRIFYQVTLCNEYLRQTTSDVLDERGVPADFRAEIDSYRAEARFLRALSYWHALDLFRNVPFVTEDDPIGKFQPEQATPQELFSFIESELTEIEAAISPSRQNEYGRADAATVQMLLAKLYLNAEVYISQDRYTDALAYAQKVINAGFELDPLYQNLFLADNHKSPEMIFPITQDGNFTRTWGGMTFIIRAGLGGSMPAEESGVVNGWAGVRTTRQLVEKFPPGGGSYIESTEGNTASYPKIYIPNSTQGFDATDTDNSLASTGDMVYEGHVYFPEANGEFFIAKFPSSSPQVLGDSDLDGMLETNGSNIVLSDAGLYFVQVDLKDNSYVVEKRDFSVIGDATPGGWDNDTPMTYDEELNAMRVKLDMVPGGLKFRANGSWDVSFGDGELDAILEYDGDDIVIVDQEAYEIFLYLDKPDYTYDINLISFDRRAIFWSDGQNLDIEDVATFTEGYAVRKFKNVTSTGEPGSNLEHPDTDFPMFRLADAYLMAAEAILRGAAGGTEADAVEYFNEVRTRAYTSTSANVSAGELTLDLILDERARELYWECHRRTDLVRFGQFTDGDYLWQWKGGVQEGAKTESYRNIFPIPNADRAANPNLDQNPGY